ncbi:MAG: hypothetical protein GIX03_07320 [Candidatus Eremiobacteraeota bacterium]|nr:hypothetical protein [Candidatus Eremiobacteraeota bacterium]MBC5802801.1 hypothetical protein [Candidatus Eremiobacteraeota bacterium]MBC5820741.1 hypothetical protein [Candidatus Eremiobacteraeota bacterium]
MGFAANVSGAVASTDDRGAQTFAERVADYGHPANVKTTIGHLPDGWSSSVPLPADVPILGVVQHIKSGLTEIYYQPPDAASADASYVSGLKEAGYVATDRSDASADGGGFRAARKPSTSSLYCHGAQGVEVSVPQPHGDDLRVAILATKQDAPDACVAEQPLAGSPYDTPIPPLVGPQGATVAAGGLGSFGISRGAEGATTDAAFGALITGNVTPSQLLRLYQSQLVRAGWRVTAVAQSPDAAYASFTYGAHGTTWNAALGLSPAGTHAVRAQLVASGATITRPVPRVPHVPTLSGHVTKSDRWALLALVRRIVNDGTSQHTRIFVGTLPSDLPASIPLPHGVLVGSTEMIPSTSSADPSNGRNVFYYTLTGDQLDAYARALQSAGWTAESAVDPSAGFVSSSRFDYVTYCKPGLPALTASVYPATNSVSIRLERTVSTIGCRGLEPFQWPHSPLPKIVAPAGVVSGWQTGGGGSSASFDSPLPPTPLLDAFTTQLSNEGWSALTKTANDTLGCATYARTGSDGKRVDVALTVYRRNTAAKAYTSFIAVTNIGDPALTAMAQP